MKHEFCQCGHEHKFRECILCDCQQFQLERTRTIGKKPKVSTWLKKIVRKMDMNR